MRFIGRLLDESQARRFTSYLLLKGVVIRAEPEADGWAVWVRDEDHVSEAREAFDAFRAAPTDSRFVSAEAEALEKQREILARERFVQRQYVDMSRRWEKATTGPRPLTVTLAVLSLLVFLLTNGGDNLGSILGDLTFCRIDAAGMAPVNGYTDILHGEVWRLVTPIFLHFGAAHLLFNVMALFWLASPIERSRGTPVLGAMTILIAIGSNVLQYAWSESPLFGGLSGVLFGLIGYSWLKSRQDPLGPIQMPTETMVFTMVFFVLGILREIPPLDKVLGAVLPHMANVAHASGLALGLAWAWLPAAIRRRGGK